MTSSSSLSSATPHARQKHQRFFEKGMLMFIQGEQGRDMYIIRSGTVRIFRHDGSRTRILATVGPGSVLGEMSLLDHQPRSATAQVIEPVTATVIDEEVFTSTMHKLPTWLSRMVSLVISRLRQTMQRTTNDLIRKNIPGVLRILLLQLQQHPPHDEAAPSIVYADAKQRIHDITGLGDSEIEAVMLHCILKQLMVISKDDHGVEHIRIRDPQVCELYMKYCRATHAGRKLPGETLSEAAYTLAEVIHAAGSQNGRQIKPDIVAIGIPQVEIALQRAGKGTAVDPDALDELTRNCFVLIKEAATRTKHGTHTRHMCVFNPSALQRLQLLRLWIPVFREEVELDLH